MYHDSRDDYEIRDPQCLLFFFLFLLSFVKKTSVGHTEGTKKLNPFDSYSNLLGDVYNQRVHRGKRYVVRVGKNP